MERLLSSVMMFLLTIMKISYVLDQDLQPFPKSSVRIRRTSKFAERREEDKWVFGEHMLKFPIDVTIFLLW